MFKQSVVGCLVVFATVLLLLGGGVKSEPSNCAIRSEFRPSNDEGIIPMDCQVGPEANQFSLNYSVSGMGVSAFILSEPQYNSYLEKVKQDAKYVPKIGDYVLSFYTGDAGWTSNSGTRNTKPSNTLGKVRLLIKRNPTFMGSGVIYIGMNITPQKDDSQMTTIIAVSVVGVLGVGVCFVCVAILIFCLVKRRKASYEQVI